MKNIEAKTFLHLRSKIYRKAKLGLPTVSGMTQKTRGIQMENMNCYTCGKKNLSKNEIGLTKKMLGRSVRHFFCIDCLAEQLEVDTEFLLEKIEEFKEQGCILF